MTEKDRIAELEAQLEAEKAKNKDKFTIKLGQKQNVVFSSATGLRQRFPVTLYAPGWLFLLDHADEIRDFIEANKDKLSWDR